MSCLKGCIVDDPNQSDYYLARALCYHHMKMHGLATQDIQTAQFKKIRLYPDKLSSVNEAYLSTLVLCIICICNRLRCSSLCS